MPWRQTPSQKKKAVVFTMVKTSACRDQLNAEFSKVCEKCKVRIFKICQSFTHWSVIVVTFPHPET